MSSRPTWQIADEIMTEAEFWSLKGRPVQKVFLGCDVGSLHSARNFFGVYPPLKVHMLTVQHFSAEEFEREYDLIEDAGWIIANTFPYAYRIIQEDHIRPIRISLKRLEARNYLRRFIGRLRYVPQER